MGVVIERVEPIGLWVPLTAVGAVGYGGTDPLAGVWFLQELIVWAANGTLSPTAYSWEFRARSEVPASRGEMDEGQVLFPRLAADSLGRHWFRTVAASAVTRIRFGFKFAFHGRRIVLAWYNGGSSNSQSYALFTGGQVSEGG